VKKDLSFIGVESVSHVPIKSIKTQDEAEQAQAPESQQVPVYNELYRHYLSFLHSG
jgi:hypothetical protein